MKNLLTRKWRKKKTWVDMETNLVRKRTGMERDEFLEKNKKGFEE